VCAGLRQYERSTDAYERLTSATDARGRKIEVLKVPCPPPLFRTYKEASGELADGEHVVQALAQAAHDVDARVGVRPRRHRAPRRVGAVHGDRRVPCGALDARCLCAHAVGAAAAPTPDWRLGRAPDALVISAVFILRCTRGAGAGARSPRSLSRRRCSTSIFIPPAPPQHVPVSIAGFTALV